MNKEEIFELESKAMDAINENLKIINDISGKYTWCLTARDKEQDPSPKGSKDWFISELMKERHNLNNKLRTCYETMAWQAQNFSLEKSILEDRIEKLELELKKREVSNGVECRNEDKTGSDQA